MTSTATLAMTTAEAIVASAFILAVAAVVLLIIWQLFAITRRGMDQRVSDTSHPDTNDHGPDDHSTKRG